MVGIPTWTFADLVVNRLVPNEESPLNDCKGGLSSEGIREEIRREFEKIPRKIPSSRTVKFALKLLEYQGKIRRHKVEGKWKWVRIDPPIDPPKETSESPTQPAD